MHVCVIRRGYESLRRGPAAARGRPGPFCPAPICPMPVLSHARLVPRPSCPTPIVYQNLFLSSPALSSRARFVPCPFCPEPVVLPSLLSRSPVFPPSPQHRRARSSPARARERFLNRNCFVAVIFFTAIVISLYYYIILFL